MEKTCGVSIDEYKNFLSLNDKCTVSWNKDIYPVTSLLYSLLATCAALLLFITYFFYKRVRILNCSVFVNAFTNTMWAVYFLVVLIRSIILAIQYGQALKEEEWFFANWVLGLIELLLLYYSLGCQWTHHHLAFINQEVNTATQQVHRLQKYKNKLRWVTSRRGIIILAQFMACILLIILLRFLNNWLIKWFWLYVSILCLMMLSCVTISVLIGYGVPTNESCAPSNIYFLLGTLFTITEHIPVFVWKNCLSVECWGKFSMFDIWIFFKIISLCLIFRGLILEYKWFSEECQYAVLHEVEDYPTDVVS